jgi:hypothetical protein
MSKELSPSDIKTIRRAYERVSARGWGFALGILAGLGLFVATIVLVIRGGPQVGPHLQLLGVYFPGYAVSWAGAFIGAAYAFVIGYIAGRTTGAVYNWIVDRQV